MTDDAVIRPMRASVCQDLRCVWLRILHRFDTAGYRSESGRSRYNLLDTRRFLPSTKAARCNLEKYDRSDANYDDDQEQNDYRSLH
jgi:hypothetical protein